MRIEKERPLSSISETVHIVDLFATLARVGGAEIPKDRPIDGVDQHQGNASARESVRDASYGSLRYSLLAITFLGASCFLSGLWPHNHRL
jgi:hypothetical protein